MSTDIMVSLLNGRILLEQDDNIIVIQPEELSELLEMIETVNVTKWYAECSVCPGAFAYDMKDEPENPHPNGLLCPQCREEHRNPVGVLHFHAR